MEANLKELCARIVPDLDNCTNNDKKDAYAYLDLKVKATTEGADIKGFLDPSVLKTGSCLLTTGQTSASVFPCRYSYIHGSGYTFGVSHRGLTSMVSSSLLR